MSKLTDIQTRATDRLKKAIAEFKAKPTEATQEVVKKQYAKLLDNTLDASVLTKEEVATLVDATQ